MLIITRNDKGVQVCNSDKDATVGRWCTFPCIPDLCYKCWDPKTLTHYPAEGYREEKAPKGKIWRFGTCHRCTS